jgi:hypothetical protein
MLVPQDAVSKAELIRKDVYLFIKLRDSFLPAGSSTFNVDNFVVVQPKGSNL